MPEGTRWWVAGAMLVGAIAAFLWGPLGEPYFDGRARSLLIVDILLFVAVAAVLSAGLALAGRWSLKRLAGGMFAAAGGFAACFLVMFVLLMAGGGCGPSYSEAEWEDRPLFSALDAAAQPPTGAPFGNGTFAVASLSVVSVHWWPDDNGTLFARFQPGDNETGVEWQARRLLEVATELDAQAIEDRIDAFLATRNETVLPGRGTREVVYALPQQVHLEPFLPDGAVPRGEEVDGVQVRFHAATKQADLDGHLLRVDGFGGATMEHPWGSISDEAVLAEVQRVLADHGLPVPRQVQARGDIC